MICSFHPGTVWPSLGLLTTVLLLTEAPVAGQEVSTALHFKPRDHSLGDVHPFFRDGVCFLYSLKPGHYESALACSLDLLHWTETPITHEPVKADDWIRPYYVLGVLWDDATNVFRSFYGHAGGRVAGSESTDLLHWSCAPKPFHVPPADYYARRRDPFVFWIPETRQWGCVMTTKMKGRPDSQAGAISLATSADLQHWTDHGPILDPGTIGEPECPQMFRLGKSWYLLASIYDGAVGRPTYWISDQPNGPWDRQAPRELDGKDLCAAQIGFDGNTPLLFGWIPLKPSKPGQQTWGGHLALPRQVFQLPDGTLGTRLAARLSQVFAQWPWQSQPGFAVTAKTQKYTGEWTRLAVEFSLHMPPEVTEVRVGFAPLGQSVFHPTKLSIFDSTGTCWSELPVQLPAGRPLPVQLFVENDIVEIFADGRYSLAARLPAQPGSRSLSVKASHPGSEVLSLRTCDWTLSR